MTDLISIERATSDYLSISRRAHLYGPKQYAEAEARAWERLQEAIAHAAPDGAGHVAREPEPAGT